MEELRSWLKTVTAVVIILGVAENLLPEQNSVKGVAKLVFGLTLMAAVLQPVLALFSLSWEAIAVPQAHEEEAAWLETAGRLQSAGAAPLLAAAGEGTARQLQSLLLTVDGVDEVDVTVSPRPDGSMQAHITLQGDLGLEPKVRRIAAHYLGISEGLVTVDVAMGREQSE